MYEHYPLLSILIGIALISISIGPYQNIDTQLEYEAASGVLRWGMPYIKTAGNMVNQPPLAFYIDALFFKVFGLSLDKGVAIITLFGLGCTFLVYKIGKFLYSKPTGLFAAALFALTPWQVVLSRSFLIDAQCLFFSLLFLFVGIYAIRQSSFRLFLLSGIFFGIAFLTKFFAVYALIPLGVYFVYYRPKNLRIALKWAVAFFVPAVLFAFLWYQIISGGWVLSALNHDDFLNFNSAGFVPAPLFLGNFLSNTLGVLFMAAAIFSLVICFWRRKLFAKILPFDLMCLASIVAVGSINIFLVFGLNLSSPYLNPIKYDYQFLPFLSLLAASLVYKFPPLFTSVKSKEKLSKLLFAIVSVGLVLLVIAMFLNMNYINDRSTWDHWLFRVEPDKDLGYSFINLAPIGKESFLMNVQYFGFAMVLSGLVWVGREKVASFVRWQVAKLRSGRARFREKHEA